MNEILEKNIKMYGDYKSVKIGAYKQYLTETDYQIIKLYETFVQGGSIITMLAEMKEILSNRKKAREEINKLESEE